jgi:hypothetical protein
MGMRRRAVSVAVAAAAVLAGPTVAWCHDTNFVLPWQTDAEIDEWLEPHVVKIDRDVPAKDLLFVHLPGSYDVPTNSMLILGHAADLGYPAIGLRYPNGWTMSSICRWSRAPECFEDVRLEIVTGSDATPELDIDRANSITNRLLTLIEYLEDRFPEDDWARFLDRDGEIDWAKVIVSGHSQGAGHAAMIGHLYGVARVAMFAGATDYSAYFRRPAPWVAEPGETPADRFFGFGHTADALVPANHLVELWTELGLAASGRTVNVDLEPPPYGESHMLLTSAEPDGSGAFLNHSSVVVDEFTPKYLDGSPRFSVVWSAMCFPDAEQSSNGSRCRRPVGRRGPMSVNK